MKKNRKLWKRVLMSAVAAVIAVATLGLAVGCGGNSKPLIAVIAKGETHAFWKNVQRGAEAAGEEFGYRISFRGPASEDPKELPQQKEMVTSALGNDAKALVMATIAAGFTDQLKQAKDRNIPVVQFDSGIWSDDIAALDAAGKNPIVASVATSNKLAAGMAADDFYKILKPEIEAASTAAPYVIGVVQHDKTQTGIDRRSGFVEGIAAYAAKDSLTDKVKVEVYEATSDAGTQYKEGLENLVETKGAKAIFMTNEGVVKGVKDAINAAGAKYDAIKFYGYDAGTPQIKWMKETSNKAKLYGAVAQDSYNIGYNAVKQAVNALKGEKVEDTPLPGVVWNAENLEQMMEQNYVYKDDPKDVI